MNFPFELDHLTIITRVDAPEAQALEEIGLARFGGVTSLAGLGASSTSFFFANAYLELFWAHDIELAAQKILPLGLDLDARARWHATYESPFGLMLRRKNPDAVIPFATKKLKAEWMPGETWLDFNSEFPAEPYYGVLPDSLSYPAFYDSILVKAHPLGVQKITGVRIGVISEAVSPIAQMLATAGIAHIAPAPFANLEIEFDYGAQGEAINLRPELPLVLKY